MSIVQKILKFSRKRLFHKYGHNGYQSIRNNLRNTTKLLWNNLAKGNLDAVYSTTTEFLSLKLSKMQ
ncbi:hypothetical protein T4D_12806 [Trichinella pseudospiralis]|uniref:Uncharacterized protein n=1 Tax=Trichinella pseudospiralis TaxID=6337 RepID=A0A0V1DQJ3_TRIPS|nr:hypothetical protein T4D_12806 [Trichinella pseudospiralis]